MDIPDSKTDTMHILDAEGSCWCEPKRVEVEGSENVIRGRIKSSGVASDVLSDLKRELRDWDIRKGWKK